MIHSHIKNENKATTSQFYLAQDVIPGVFAEKWAKISSFQPGGFPHSTFFKAAPLGITLNPSGNTFVFPMTHTSFLKLMPIVSSSVDQELLFRVTGWSSQVLPMRSKEMFVPTILGEYKFTPNLGFSITSPFSYSDPHVGARSVKDLTTQGILTTNQKLSGSVDPNYITLKGQGAEYIQIQMMLQEPVTATGSCCDLVTNSCTNNVFAADCLAINQKIWFQNTTCSGYSCIWNGCPEREPPCECTDTTTTCCPNECPDSVCPPGECFPCMDGSTIVCNTFNGICPLGTEICTGILCPTCDPNFPRCSTLNLIPPHCDLGSCCCDLLGECYDTNRGECAILSGINSCFEFNENTPCPSPTTCPSGIDEFGSCCDTITNTCVESFRADCLAPKIFSVNQSCFGNCTYRQVSTSDGNNASGEKNFSAVVTKFGKVRVFGNNTYPAVYTIPTDLEVIQNVQVGKSFVCALELISGTPPTSGTIKVWGQDPDSTGVLTVPSDLGPCSAISAGSSHIAVIKGTFGSPGIVQAWGNSAAISVPSNLGQCVAIDSSGAYTAAVQAVVPAGQENLNGLRLWGVVPPVVATVPDFTGYHGSNIHIIDVSISSSNAAVIFSDGSFIVWGDNSSGQLNIPSNIGTIKQISCGKKHIIVIKSNGDVVSWGLNACLQTSMPSDLGKCVSVSAGDGYSCAVKLNGLLECWSCNQGFLNFTCNDAYAESNESPCHWTSLTNASTGFYVSTTPITNKQFSGPSASNPDQPKVNQTWNVYNTWANNQSLRLLTEAEWELAARGRVFSPIYGELNDIAWNANNSNLSNKDVAQKEPNVYGLYDTIGLVKEFVFDFIYPYVASSFDNPIVNPVGQITNGVTEHIIRGGSFLSPKSECRVTWRNSVPTSGTDEDIGFRVARTATASTTWITQVMQDQATESDIRDPELRNLINNSGHSWWVRKSIGFGLFIDLKFIPNVVFNQGASSVTDSCGGNCPDIDITTLPACESLCSIIVSGKCCINTTTTGFLQGTTLKLPTEAQWEKAYRAGTTTAFHSFPGYTSGTNDDALLGNIAWYDANAGGQTHAVGGKLANALGLHDMSGNVWEWCRDWYSSTYYASSPITNPTGPSTGFYRALRGGYWNNNSTNCRASKRNYNTPDYVSYGLGFRVVHESAIGESNWYTVVEQLPNPAVITNPTLRDAIAATGRPWYVRDNVTNIDMLLIPNGTFTMGCSPSLQNNCLFNENPTHEVTMSTFYISRYPVTQAQWTAKMGSNPSYFVSENGYPGSFERPVENVSWNMIMGGSTIGCTQTNQEECAALGGSFTPNVQCAEGGLCNNIWGRCCNENICQNDVLSINCNTKDDVFTPYLINQQGSGPRCIEDCPGQLRCASETGKCCNPNNNNCQNTVKCNCLEPMVFTPSPAACYQLGSGNPLRCVQVFGACCNNLTNVCVQNEDWQCTALGSNFSFTPGGSCSGSFCSGLIGACCNIAMGQCINNVTLAQCSAQPATSGSWVWHAAPKVCFSSTQCPEETGKCCHPTNGNCFNTNQFTCTTGWNFTKDAFCTANPSNNNPSCIISLPNEPCCCLPTSPACACAGRCCNKLTNLCVDHVCDCAGLAGQWVFTDNTECEICNNNCICAGLSPGTKVCEHQVCTSFSSQGCGGIDCNFHFGCSNSNYCTGNFPLGPTMSCLNPCDDCIATGPFSFCPINCGLCVETDGLQNITTCGQFYSYNNLSFHLDTPSDFQYNFPGNGNPSDASDEGAYGIDTKADLCTDTNQCPGYPKKTSGSTPFVRWNRYNSGVDSMGTSQPRFIGSNLNNQLREEFDMFISCGCKDSTGKSSIDVGWNLKAKPWVCDARHQVNTTGYLEITNGIIPSPADLNSTNRSLLPINITPKDITGIDLDSPLMRSWPMGNSWGVAKRRLRECDGRAFWANTSKKNWEILGCTDNTCTAYATDTVDTNNMIGYLSIFGNNWTNLNSQPRTYSPGFQYKKFSNTTFIDSCTTCKFGSSMLSIWNLFRTVNSEAMGTPFTLFNDIPITRVCPTTAPLSDSTGTTNEFTVFIQSFSS